jgi:hypothetical protein
MDTFVNTLFYSSPIHPEGSVELVRLVLTYFAGRVWGGL